MGYRLTVERVGDKNPYFYGTKLYGYEDEELFKSYHWLIEKEFLRDDRCYFWFDGQDNAIVMNAKEFKEFAKLYNEDYNKYSPYEHKPDCFISDPDLQEFFKLDDWRLIVISWG